MGLVISAWSCDALCLAKCGRCRARPTRSPSPSATRAAPAVPSPPASPACARRVRWASPVVDDVGCESFRRPGRCPRRSPSWRAVPRPARSRRVEHRDGPRSVIFFSTSAMLVFVSTRAFIVRRDSLRVTIPHPSLRVRSPSCSARPGRARRWWHSASLYSSWSARKTLRPSPSPPRPPTPSTFTNLARRPVASACNSRSPRPRSPPRWPASRAPTGIETTPRHPPAVRHLSFDSVDAAVLGCAAGRTRDRRRAPPRRGERFNGSRI